MSFYSKTILSDWLGGEAGVVVKLWEKLRDQSGKLLMLSAELFVWYQEL